uniref:Uncharacterized protein n=1 Tax=Rhizophora mucronata TaxID=61149 RepID=A0A2P2QYI4_RHIMU
MWLNCTLYSSFSHFDDVRTGNSFEIVVVILKLTLTSLM